MRKLIIAIFLVLSSIQIIAQNWIPLNLTDKYNYKLDTSTIITNTIWVDSVSVVNGDSVFYLNRIITDCDTCSLAIGVYNNSCYLDTIYPCDSCFALENQPQFFQRKMVKKGDGIYSFEDTAKFVILSKAKQNDTWIFDTLNSINAQVINISLELIFGNTDSVKIIALSSNDTIKISKNYGILLFPHKYGMNSKYFLTGIEGRNLGEKLPDFWDIFNFSIGDVFQYNGDYGYAGDQNIYTKKYTIASKQVSGDTLFYEIQGIINGTWWAWNPWPPLSFPYNYTYTDTLIYIDSANHTTNKYNYEKVEMCNQLTGACYPACLISKLRAGIDGQNLVNKTIGDIGNIDYIYYPLDSFPDILGKQPYIAANTIEITYTESLGRVYFSHYFFEGSEEESLLGYIKGMDTVGTITPDSILLKINSNIITRKDNIKIYPNPFLNKIFIEYKLVNPANITIEVYNLFGQKVITLLENIKNDAGTFNVSFDVSKLPNGIYFYTLQTENSRITKSMIKMQ
ncbi:MAG: T9SS type A sorting domain-containing protein [Cytophagales bacterium]|nr:T9SS type A sorting domain-containing protein [Cytophagales bacterium]